ncbi:histidine--tRNA ligase [Candidatus Dojkabacteria bacterium]|nr:histidine--tRNA ligase [Candidatus Dojkabacteria bacterium]
MAKIEPRTLKGFRDFLPDKLRFRKAVFKVFEQTFEKYGFEPLETPALEYFDILMDKYGEEEKLVYNFEDFGGRRVALIYDLTVPTARVLAQYQNEIKLPWKRYQIQPVFRADNTQKGRFREFYQCDVDTFGTNSLIVDAEFIIITLEILEQLGFKDFKIRMNNRKILNAIAEYANNEDKFFEIIYAIDKWDKRSKDDTLKALIEKGLRPEDAEKAVKIVELSTNDSEGSLDKLEELLKDTKDGLVGIKEVREILKLVDDKRLVYDGSIARGLAYYTGPIYEVTVADGGVGSVAGGGRYDEMIGTMTSRDIPASGISFGLERIIEVMMDRGSVEKDDLCKEQLSNEVEMVAVMPGYEKEAFQLADKLRKECKKIFLYPDSSKKLKKQFEFADKKGFKKVYVLGENEIKAGSSPSVRELE